jgi:hypothetical protein
MPRSSRPPPRRTLKGVPAIRGAAIGFWVFSGFVIGLGTSLGARILLCPSGDDLHVSPPPAVVPPPITAPAASSSHELTVDERMAMARMILATAADGDGVWTEAHRLALQKEVAQLPETERHEIVHEMVVAFHAGKLRPE